MGVRNLQNKTQSTQNLTLFSLKENLFLLDKDTINLKDTIKKCKKKFDLKPLKNLLNHNLIYNGSMWNYFHVGSIQNFIKNVKTFYLNNLQEKYNYIRQLLDFFSSNFHNIELFSKYKITLTIIEDRLYAIKKNEKFENLGHNKTIRENSDSLIGVEVLSENQIGNAIFLDLNCGHKPIFTIKKENFKDISSDYNRNFIDSINFKLDLAKKMFESMKDKDFNPSEYRIKYIEEILQKIDNNPSISNERKILSLENALNYANNTKYYNKIFNKLIDNYVIFIKKLLALSEISKFGLFLDKIICKYNNQNLIPIAAIIIEFADGLNNFNYSINFYKKAFIISSNTQKLSIRRALIKKFKRYHTSIIEKIKRINTEVIGNLGKKRITRFHIELNDILKGSDFVKILDNLAKLIISVEKKVPPQIYIDLLKKFIEISNKMKIQTNPSYKKKYHELQKLFSKRVNSLVDKLH